MMQWGGLSVFREGNIIDMGITQFQVVDACSGLRYVYPLLLMGFVFAYLFHKRWWDRIIIILATIPISIVSNALRIAITGYLTIHVSQEVADGFFHGFSGWLIFMVSFIILAVLSWLLKRIKTPAPQGHATGGDQPETVAPSFDLSHIKLGYLWGASVLFLAFWWLSISFASNIIIPERKPFKGFPTEIGDWKGERTFLREEILNSLWADDYVQIRFQHEKTRDVVLLFVPYYGYQETRHTAHAPAACLIGGGYASRSREVLERNFPAPFGRVGIGRMVLEKDGMLLLSNYWFQMRGRIIESEYMNKWFLFWDSLTRRRTDGALVRIEMPMRPGQDVETAQSIVDGFTRMLMKILPDYVPG
jgi:exosortase D (VPLPA-CTERM-specific)